MNTRQAPSVSARRERGTDKERVRGERERDFYYFTLCLFNKMLNFRDLKKQCLEPRGGRRCVNACACVMACLKACVMACVKVCLKACVKVCVKVCLKACVKVYNS